MNGGQFAINLGVHPVALLDGRGNVPDPKTINVDLCEFRRRLSEVHTDQWWSYLPDADSMRFAVREAAEVYVRGGRRLFHEACDQRSGFDAITAADLSAGDINCAGFGTTFVRMAWALALLRKNQGRAQEAVAFAVVGLARVGNTVWLRKELEALAGAAA